MAPADVFYNEEEARKYTINTRMITIQEKMTKRALELLAIPKGKSKLILDIGCGSGISGSIVGSKGHMWIGTDISRAMLQVASEREVEGDVMHSDMGHGFGFRHGTFDGAISISAIQWLILLRLVFFLCHEGPVLSSLFLVEVNETRSFWIFGDDGLDNWLLASNYEESAFPSHSEVDDLVLQNQPVSYEQDYKNKSEKSY